MISFFNIEFIIAAGFFLGAIFLARKSFKYAFWAFMVSIPLMHKQLFSLVIWDLMPARLIAGGAIIWGMIYLTSSWRNIKTVDQLRLKIIEIFRYDPFGVLLVLLWIIRAFSLLISPTLRDSVALFAFYTLIVGMYFIFKLLIDKYGLKFYYKALQIYMSLGVLTALFAVFQYQQRICCRNTWGAVWVIPDVTPRLGSTFWDVNHYGAFLITVIPLFFTFIFISKSWRNKILLGALTLFQIGILIMTQSRSAWIGLFFGMLAALAVYYWNELKRPILVAIIATIIGVTGLLTFTTISEISIRDQVAQYMHYRLDSTDTHFMLLEGAGEIFINNLVIGSGYGSFDSAFRETDISKVYFGREPKIEGSKVPPHSVWGEVLGETGVLGILTYGLFVILLIASVITAIFKSSDSNQKYLGIGIFGSLISVFIAGLFYSYNLEFFWMTIFLAIGYTFLIFKNKFSIQSIIAWWSAKKFLPYAILIPAASFYLFLRLGSTTLIDWDEAIYAKVARNIVESGDWLSLRWENMDRYWFEKPPLYMWLTAGVFQITNFNAIGARLVSALFGLGGILMVYKFGAAMYNRLTGLFAAFILLSTVAYLYYSRNGMLDITVTFFIVATLYFFYCSLNSDKYKNTFAVLSGVMLGLGVMTKAIIGLLPIPISILYLGYSWYFYRQKFTVWQVLLFTFAAIAVAAPWHVYSYIVHGESFWKEYFMKHIFNRGVTGLGHEKPTLWYLDAIRTSFRIWLAPFLIGLVVLPFIDKKRKELGLLFISILFIFVFFSASKDKLLWYIIPIYPFMALFAARFMERFVVIVNSAFRKEIQLSSIAIRSIALIAVAATSMVYVVIMRDRVYYPDFNGDMVAMIKIHNEIYPIEQHNDLKLYYTDAAPPVILFYSDHRIEHADKNKILKLIDDAAYDTSYMFLMRESVYYDIRGRQKEVSVPLELSVRGSSGDWVLIKSWSQLEYYRDLFDKLRIEMQTLSQKEFLKEITDDELVRLDEVRIEYGEVLNKLTEYGHSPF